MKKTEVQVVKWMKPPKSKLNRPFHYLPNPKRIPLTHLKISISPISKIEWQGDSPSTSTVNPKWESGR